MPLVKRLTFLRQTKVTSVARKTIGDFNRHFNQNDLHVELKSNGKGSEVLIPIHEVGLKQVKRKVRELTEIHREILCWLSRKLAAPLLGLTSPRTIVTLPKEE